MEKAIHDNEDDLGKFKKLKMKDIKSILESKRPISVDIAMFGRMVTDTVMHNVEAAVQVAHAISTNRLQREFDYFTAVDDLMEEENEIGAGMIGDVEFNSSCFYEYFSVDMTEFIKNLSCGREDENQQIREIAQKALIAFIEASIFTTPTGKQNAFAAHQLPSAIYVEIKPRKIPVSLANAFAKPAEAKGKGLVEDSVEKLAVHIDLIHRKFFDKENDVTSFWFTTMDGIRPETTQICDTLPDLKGNIQAALNKG
jgi:CRISPR system Cascade subunit CasC